MYMSKKYSEKLEKHLWRGLFCESCGITYYNLLEIQQSCFARNLTKVLFAALKYIKKALTTVMKENLRLKQLRLNYINNQKNQTKKRTPNISNKLF